MKHKRKNTRKEPCRDCGAKCGSAHKDACPWAYIQPPDTKGLRTVTLRDKIKAIIKIIKA